VQRPAEAAIGSLRGQHLGLSPYIGYVHLAPELERRVEALDLGQRRVDQVDG